MTQCTLAPDVLLEPLKDEAIALDMATGQYFELNATAYQMLDQLLQGNSIEATAAWAAKRWKTDIDHMRHDVATLIQTLHEQGLVIDAD